MAYFHAAFGSLDGKRFQIGDLQRWSTFRAQR